MNKIARSMVCPTFMATKSAVHPTYVHAHSPVPLVLDKDTIENSIAKARELHDRVTVLSQCLARLLKYCPDHMQNCSCEIFRRLKTPGWKKHNNLLLIGSSCCCQNSVHHGLSAFSCPWQRHTRRIALNNTWCCSSSCFVPKLSSLTTWTRLTVIKDGWP